jgi:hypothetical protein
VWDRSHRPSSSPNFWVMLWVSEDILIKTFLFCFLRNKVYLCKMTFFMSPIIRCILQFICRILQFIWLFVSGEWKDHTTSVLPKPSNAEFTRHSHTTVDRERGGVKGVARGSDVSIVCHRFLLSFCVQLCAYFVCIFHSLATRATPAARREDAPSAARQPHGQQSEGRDDGSGDRQQGTD